MTPHFQLIANDKDVTDTLKTRLTELIVTENSQTQADSLVLTLANSEPIIKPPEPGSQLNVAIGYQETGLIAKGSYTLDELELSGPPHSMTLIARSADFTENLKIPKMRSFDNIILGQLLGQIAKEQKYDSQIDNTLAKYHFEHIDQTNESDMHLLTRLTKPIEALFCIKHKTLIIDHLKSPYPRPTLPIRTEDILSYQYSRPSRYHFKSVKGYYHTRSDPTLKPYILGDGNPCYTIPTPFCTLNEVKAQVKAKYLEYIAEEQHLTLTLIGNPAITTGHALALETPRIKGQYNVTSVQNRINAKGMQSRTMLEYN